MERTRHRQPALGQLPDPIPCGSVLLAAATECPSPKPSQPVAEYSQPIQVARYRVVVEVALDDRLEPSPRLRNRVVHALAKLLLNFPQLGSHSLGDRLAFEDEVPLLALPADVGEA